MKKKLFYFLGFVIFVSCQVKPKVISQTEANICSDFKTGKFKINHKFFGMTTSVIRNDSMQIEQTEFAGTTVKFTFSIEWLNECMYELTPNPSFQNDIDMSNEYSIVKIKKIEENTVYYKSYPNGKKLRTNSNKMIKIE